VPTFVPLDDAGDMQLVQGPQGGYHVFVQVRLLGLDPTTVTLTRYFCDPLDPVCDQTSALRFQTDSPPMFCDHDVDWVMAEEQLTYLCPSRKQGQAMDGRTLHLRVVATDAGGRRLTADRAIHPNCPPGDTLCATNDVFGCAAP